MTSGPNGPGRIESLQFDANEIFDLGFLDGSEKVIDVAAGNGNLRNQMQFVSRLMQSEEVQR